MKLISLNVGLPREIIYKDRSIITGIFKDPVEGRIRARRLNLDGDGCGALGLLERRIAGYEIAVGDVRRKLYGRRPERRSE